MDFQVVMAQYGLGNFDSADLIEFGVQALVEGYDSLHLRWLAGENPRFCNGEEVKEYFERALRELGLTLPTWQESVRIIIRYWAERIVAGEVTPEEGARKAADETYYQSLMFLSDMDPLWKALGVERWMWLVYSYDEWNEYWLGDDGEPISEADFRKIVDADVLAAARDVLAQGNAV